MAHPETAIGSATAARSLLFTFEFVSQQRGGVWGLEQLGQVITATAGILGTGLEMSGETRSPRQLSIETAEVLFAGPPSRSLTEIVTEAEEVAALAAKFPSTTAALRDRLLAAQRSADALGLQYGVQVESVEEDATALARAIARLEGRIAQASGPPGRLRFGGLRVVSVRCESPAVIQVVADVSNITDPLVLKVFIGAVSAALTALAFKGRAVVRACRRSERRPNGRTSSTRS